MTTGRIGLVFGGIVVVAGLIATLLGGITGDFLRNRGVKGAYFHVAGWSTALGFPCFVAMLYVPFPLAWVLIFFTVFACSSTPARRTPFSPTSAGPRSAPPPSRSTS